MKKLEVLLKKFELSILYLEDYRIVDNYYMQIVSILKKNSDINFNDHILYNIWVIDSYYRVNMENINSSDLGYYAVLSFIRNVFFILKKYLANYYNKEEFEYIKSYDNSLIRIIKNENILYNNKNVAAYFFNYDESQLVAYYRKNLEFTRKKVKSNKK